jgi:hypothetical protein
LRPRNQVEDVGLFALGQTEEGKIQYEMSQGLANTVRQLTMVSGGRYLESRIFQMSRRMRLLADKSGFHVAGSLNGMKSGRSTQERTRKHGVER